MHACTLKTAQGEHCLQFYFTEHEHKSKCSQWSIESESERVSEREREINRMCPVTGTDVRFYRIGRSTMLYAVRHNGIISRQVNFIECSRVVVSGKMWMGAWTIRIDLNGGCDGDFRVFYCKHSNRPNQLVCNCGISKQKWCSISQIHLKVHTHTISFIHSKVGKIALFLLLEIEQLFENRKDLNDIRWIFEQIERTKSYVFFPCFSVVQFFDSK